MPEYDTTDNTTEHPMMDAEDWELALEVYDGFPGQALTLGFHFVVLKSYLVIEPLKIQEAVASLDLGMEVLFKYTDFHGVAYGLFRKLVQGQLTLEEEELKSLGLKF
jgi:hypothetical protein